MSTTAHPNEERGLEETQKPLQIYYMKMIEPQSDARLGKLAAGRIVALDETKARRWLTARVAVQATERDYTEQQDRLSQRQTAAQNAFNALSDQFSQWDVATYRDVLTAPEGGLRLAYERGVPLVNVHMLRDEFGNPISPDADIEEILEARQYLHADFQSPLTTHDRSSVMGGGSMYDMPMPLHPEHRATAKRIMEQDSRANVPTAFQQIKDAEDRKLGNRVKAPAPGSLERGTRAQHRRGRQYGQVAAEGRKIAQEQGLKPPQPATLDQTVGGDPRPPEDRHIPGGG